MCTVSFIKVRDDVFITSNRDEQTARPAALPPKKYAVKSGNIIFPKDGLAGGTWIAMHENGNTMVLMNGGKEAHVPHPPYARSRGLVFLEIFDSASPIEMFRNIALENIEPFTLIIWEQQQLWEASWSGSEKAVTGLSEDVPHIWSSSTLYDLRVREKREVWFHKWYGAQKEITKEAIENFHEFAGEGDSSIDLRMNRAGILQTVSITSILLSPGQRSFDYKDLLEGKTYTHLIQQ
jgi:uncharacterized protein with NRDE domain